MNHESKESLNAQAFPGGMEKEMMDMIQIHDRPLPYPMERQIDARGKSYEYYQIPMSDREKVLHEYYPFTPVPKLDEVLLDIHENKTFTVKDYLIIREKGRNYLVSPYYPKSYGTVLDWVAAEPNLSCYVNAIKSDMDIAQKEKTQSYLKE